jgi:hypothetical protein
MKKRIVAVLLPVALLLAGCMSVRLGYSMDANGVAVATWQAEANPPDTGDEKMDLQAMGFARTLFAQMATRWEAAGMTAQTGGTGGAATVTGRREFTGTREEAFAKLEGWMKDAQGSPFRSVKSNHVATTAAEEYLLDAEVDWEDLADPSTVANAPAGVRTRLDLALKAGKITVTLSLPGTAVEHEGALTEAGGIATCAVETSPGKPARILLHTRVVHEMVVPPERPLLEIWGLPGILALCGLAMLAIAVIGFVKRRKKTEV